MHLIQQLRRRVRYTVHWYSITACAHTLCRLRATSAAGGRVGLTVMLRMCDINQVGQQANPCSTKNFGEITNEKSADKHRKWRQAVGL